MFTHLPIRFWTGPDPYTNIIITIPKYDISRGGVISITILYSICLIKAFHIFFRCKQSTPPTTSTPTPLKGRRIFHFLTWVIGLFIPAFILLLLSLVLALHHTTINNWFIVVPAVSDLFDGTAETLLFAIIAGIILNRLATDGLEGKRVEVPIWGFVAATGTLRMLCAGWKLAIMGTTLANLRHNGDPWFPQCGLWEMIVDFVNLANLYLRFVGLAGMAGMTIWRLRRSGVQLTGPDERSLMNKTVLWCVLSPMLVAYSILVVIQSVILAREDIPGKLRGNAVVAMGWASLLGVIVSCMGVLKVKKQSPEEWALGVKGSVYRGYMGLPVDSPVTGSRDSLVPEEDENA